MRVLSIVSHSEEETEALARRLALSFNAGDVVILTGSLGSGKTTFVRALAAARGVDEKLINSPSYTFVNEYGGEPPIFHFDLYRLGDKAELTEIGWDDYLARDGIVLVEWGERAVGRMPYRYYVISFRVLSENEREIDLALVQP